MFSMPYVRIFLVSTSLEAPRSSSLEQSSLSLLSAFLPSHFSLKKFVLSDVWIFTVRSWVSAALGHGELFITDLQGFPLSSALGCAVRFGGPFSGENLTLVEVGTHIWLALLLFVYMERTETSEESIVPWDRLVRPNQSLRGMNNNVPYGPQLSVRL